MMLKRTPNLIPLFALFCFALALRAGFSVAVFLSHDAPDLFSLMPDSWRYVEIAGRIGGSVHGEERLVFSGPGYGIFLYLCFELFGYDPVPVVALQVILGALTCCFVAMIASRLFDGQGALLAGYISACLPGAIVISSAVLTETLFMFLFSASLLLLLRSSEKPLLLIASGLLAGIAALVRPIAVAWPLIVPFIALLKSRTCALSTLLYSVCAISVIAAWVARNYVIHGAPIFSTAGTTAIVDYVMAQELMEREGLSRDKALASLAEDVREATPPIADEVVASEAGRLTVIKRAVWERPSSLFLTGIRMAIGNILASDHLHAILLGLPWPVSVPLVIRMIPSAAFLFALIALICQRRWYAFTLVSGGWTYFAIFSSLSSLQGSRLFLPAMIFWVPAVAWLLTMLLKTRRRDIESAG